MIAGRMRHRDSAGHEGLLSNGGVQWMTAGRGVIHSELPEQEDGRMEGFQLWLNLPAKDKMRAPWYRDIQSAEIPEFTTPEGVKVRVIAGREPRRRRRDAARSDRAAVSRPRAAGGRDASRRRCRRRTTRSSTCIAAACRSAARTCRCSGWRSSRNDAGSDGVVLTAPAADARAADRRQAAGRADRAVRPVRDEHAGRDHPGGAGLPGRQVRGLNAVQAPALPSSHPSPAAERGFGTRLEHGRMAFARARPQCLPFCCHDSSPAFPFSRPALPLPGPSMQREGDRSLRRLRSRIDILRKGHAMNTSRNFNRPPRTRCVATSTATSRASRPRRSPRVSS